MNRPSNVNTYLQPGQICGFFDKEHFYIGMIESVAERAICIYSETNTILNLNPARLVIISDAVYPLSEKADILLTFKTTIGQLSSSLTAAAIWQKLNGWKKELTMLEMIEHCNIPLSDAGRFALFEVLKETPHMFRHKGEFYLVLDEQESRAALAAEDEHKQELVYRESIRNWIEHIFSAPSSPLQIEQDMQNRLEAELSLHPYSKPIKWLHYIFHNLAPDKQYIDCIILLRKALCQIDDNTDRNLAISGLPVLFPQSVLDAASDIQPYNHDDCRPDLTELECWSIDASETEDVDDAISLEKTDSGWSLGIHISDVSYFISKGSVIDLEAEKRTSSIYLPDSTIHMLPETISCDKASLQVNKARPALSVICRIDNDYSIISSDIVLSSITVKRRFSYEEFELYFSELCPESDIHSKVSVLQQIVKKHLQLRINSGARIIEDTEQTPSRRLIAELMVIYNSTMAAYAKTNKLPFLYRYLEEQIPEQMNNKLNEQLIFPASVLGTDKVPHQAMGLDIYAQLTSPLRRYSDLVNQRQIIAGLAKKSVLYSTDYLESLIPHLMQTRQNIRQVTNQSERQWQSKQI